MSSLGTTGGYLLDSNVVSEIANHNQTVIAKLNQAQAVFLPSIVLGELYFGVYKIAQTRRGRDLRAEYDALANRVGVLPCDRATADFYARVRGELELKGQRIPENDMWIAALALQHGLALATRDGHFKRVNGLAVELW